MHYVSYLITASVFYLFFAYIVKAVLILSVIIVIVITIMSSSTTSEESSPTEETSTIDNDTQQNHQLTDDTMPSIFINNDLLINSTVACFENKNVSMKSYNIQDMTFLEGCRPYCDGFNSSHDKLVKFVLEEVDSRSNVDKVSASDNNVLLTKYRRVDPVGKGVFGYLINDKVYLSMRQWHTIVKLSDDLLNCIVCDAYFEPLSMEEHINTKAHLNQLLKYKPLRRFEFSITRKIDDIFHCGVCNVAYYISEEHDHNDDSNHESRLLDALDRASELLDNSDDLLNNSSDMVAQNPKFTDDKYINDDWSVEIDDFGSDNSDLDDKSDEEYDDHTNSDIPLVVLLKYVQNIDTCQGTIDNKFHTTTEMANIKRSDVIKLTSNCVSEAESHNDRHNLGIKGNMIKHIGITKHDDHEDTVQDRTLNGVPPKPESRRKSFESRKSQQSKETTAQVNAEKNYIYSPTDKYMDENVQIIIKKTHFVIDMFAFNTIVFYGDTKYCFLCKSAVSNGGVCSHINNRIHKDNMLKHSYLENYSKHLIRQDNFKYHCGICNVVINHTHLTHHVEWATHQKLSIQCKTKKSLRKSTKVINVATQREDKISNVNAPKVKIIFHVQIVATPTQMTPAIDKMENKKLNLNGSVLNIDFYSWNGLCKLENGFRCLICEANLTENIEMHCKERHSDVVLYNIDKTYCPALMRKLSEKYIHCVACNKLLLNNYEDVSRHISVKKHQKNHSKLISNEKFVANKK